MLAGALNTPRTVLDSRLAQLDPRLRQKYDALEDGADALATAARAAVDVWRESHQRLIEARYAHAASEDSEKRDPHVLAQKRAGIYTPGPRLQATAAALARAEERAAPRLAERDRIEQERADAWAVVHAVTELVTSADPLTLSPVIVPRPSATNPAADLARVRETLTAAKREATVLAHAPIPLDEAGVALDGFLDRIASEYEPPVIAFAIPHQSIPPSRDDFSPYRLAPVLAGLPPFRVLLHARLAAAYQTLPASIPSGDRAALTAKLTDRLRHLAVQEEALVLTGTGLTRRPDADAGIVLTVILG